MIYIFHFFMITILYIVFGRNKRTEYIFVSSSFLYVLIVYGQRWMTGTDFPNYLRYYIADFTRSEWGYFGLQSLLRDQNLYFGILIFIVLLITQVNFYRFFLEFENKASMMIAIFLISEMFFGQMSQIRQYAAISFFINSYYAAYKSKYPSAIINLVLAYSFHSSALFFTPFLFIKIPVNRRLVIAVLLISLFLPLIDIHFIFNLPIFSRYSGYVGGYFDVPLGFNHYIKYYTVLLIVLFYTFQLKYQAKVNYNRFIYNGLMLYLLIYGVSFQFAPLYRIATYFQVFEIVFLVQYSGKLRNIPDYISEKLVALLFLGIFSLSSLVDSPMIRDYEFRPLRVYENRSIEQINYEIETFYDNYEG